MIKQLAIVVLVSLFVYVASRKECNARNGFDTTYCVCNVTYCDNLDVLVQQASGTADVYETNKKGDRFHNTKLSFKAVSQRNNASQIFTIDRNKKYQTIIGFGGAFTDASGLNIKSLPKELAEVVLIDYFDETGIEYSLGRVPIAGCDFSPRAYTYDDHVNDDNLTQWALQTEDYEYKIPYLLQVLKLNSTKKLRLFASPWSSPAWMKDNNKLNNGGVLIGSPGGKYYKIWADYIVKFFDAYKKNGINFWGMTVENEPFAGFLPNYGFNCLGLTPETERDFVKLDLGPALTKAGYTPDKFNVMVYDDNKHYLNSTGIQQYADAAFKDTEAAKYLSGIAYHCYGNPESKWEILDEVHDAHPSRWVLSTECCQEFTILPKNTFMRMGVWDNSEKYAYDILMNLQHWVTGWVEWNMALDMYGQPNWAGFSSEAPIMVNATAKEYYKDPKFYVIGHFSKFIKPDSVRIGLTATNAISNVEAVAFSRPDNSTVVIVYNLNDSPHNITINDSKYGDISTTIAAHSIQSYIWWG